jgi:pyruvate dehydrogenase E2 component (dihydrolipoamide acetyltransferase)
MMGRAFRRSVVEDKNKIHKGTDAVIEFKLPELGENIEQGDLVRRMVAPGATVSTGQSVMELETDKAVVEVPSSVSGTVQEIRVKEGDKIKVGQVIFTVDGAEASLRRQPQQLRRAWTKRRQPHRLKSRRQLPRSYAHHHPLLQP